ncbi:MAG: hypothetical protein NTY04_02650 [Candidatus Staskawiczbacteria bacterium]|nr:hypothetical protein [Candidatus Staskawiczbacteria bacterium]
MARRKKSLIEKNKKQLFILAGIILLVLLAGNFLYNYFVSKNVNRYLIENKYYGFKLQTPKGWIAKESTLYSENEIGQILSECKSNKSSSVAYQLGDFIFESQRYPEGFGVNGNFPPGLTSGVSLEITISCVSVTPKIELANYNTKISGEKAVQTFINLLGFGNTKDISFYHNNLKYEISENIYIPPVKKGLPAALLQQKTKLDYSNMVEKIVSSFKLTK